MFYPDLWLRQQLWEQLWKGPGAVSAYWSIAIKLVCVGLSALGPKELQGPNFWILSIIILLGVLLILSDKIAASEITDWACCASLPRKAEIVSKNSELNRSRWIVFLTHCG